MSIIRRELFNISLRTFFSKIPINMSIKLINRFHRKKFKTFKNVNNFFYSCRKIEHAQVVWIQPAFEILTHILYPVRINAM